MNTKVSVTPSWQCVSRVTAFGLDSVRQESCSLPAVSVSAGRVGQELTCAVLPCRALCSDREEPPHWPGTEGERVPEVAVPALEAEPEVPAEECRCGMFRLLQPSLRHCRESVRVLDRVSV